MGCGCSMHNKRVAAMQKAKDQTTSAEEIGDAGQNTLATAINEQQAGLEPAPPRNEKRDFLQGVSPPSSPISVARKDSPAALASDTDPPLPETGNAPPVALPAMELGKGDGIVPRTEGGVAVVPLAAPSNGGRRTGEGGEMLEGGEGGGGGRERTTGRSVEQILQSGESQERPRRSSNQDPLPHIAPLPAGSADLASIQRRGHTLGPGLDIGFREEPASIVPITAADALISGEGSGSSNGNTTRGGVRPVPLDDGHDAGGVGSARHANQGGQGNSDGVLIVSPVLPDEELDEDIMSDGGASVKDRWPRNDGGGDFTPTSGRGRNYDRMGDEGGNPPRHEARPALAAGASETVVPQAATSSSFGGRGGLSAADFAADGDKNDLSAATGGMGSSGDDGAWGATSGAYSLLDADEEGFMESLLMES